jgi:RNA polymerase sigma factor (sigma-70 family)
LGVEGTGTPELSDVVLVDRVLSGQPGAFETFYERYSRLIYACVAKRVSPSDKDDVTQDFFERLAANGFRMLAAWQRGRPLAVFLAVAVRNHTTDFLRRRGRQTRHLDDRDVMDVQEGDFSTHTAALEQESGSEARELRRLSLRACGALEPRDRRLLRLKLLTDLPADKIAEGMQMTPGATRTGISRAQARLVAGLGRLAPEYSRLGL